MTTIDYAINEAVTADEFIALLKTSTLAERRPVDDRACIEGMLEHGNLTVSARHAGKLVGIARSVTDFHYACYLSDLAVSREHQRLGVGRRLMALTQGQLGPRCTLILLAAPAAKDYYGHVGFSRHTRCWVLARDEVVDDVTGGEA